MCAAPSTRSRTGACASARWSATPTSLSIGPSEQVTVLRSGSRAPQASAQRRGNRAFCCSAPAASTSRHHQAVQQAQAPGQAAQRGGLPPRLGDPRHSHPRVSPHPSDMAVALVALDALSGPDPRSDDSMPTSTASPATRGEHGIARGEQVTAVDLPPLEVCARSRCEGARPRSMPCAGPRGPGCTTASRDTRIPRQRRAKPWRAWKPRRRCGARRPLDARRAAET